MFAAPGFQVGYKLVLAFTQCYRQDGDISSTPNMKLRLAKMVAEIAGIQITNPQKIILFRFQIFLDLANPLDNLFLITIH